MPASYNSNNPTFIRGEAGAVSRPVLDKLLELRTPFDFGAVGDGATDDTAALQAWINSVMAAPIVEGPVGSLYCPAGYKFLISDTLVINKPVILNMQSAIWLAAGHSSGKSIIRVNQVAPTAGQNKGYDLYLPVLRHINGLVTDPTGINSSGTCGVEICNSQFNGRVHIGVAQGFTKAGLFLNSSNNRYSGQHNQDNRFDLGEFAYCGAGLYMKSVSAVTGAAQVNYFNIQNMFHNFKNIFLEDWNTNNNIFDIMAIDAPAPGGIAIDVEGSYNQFRIGFLYGEIAFRSTAYENEVTIGHDAPTGVVVSDATGRNRVTTGLSAIANPCLPGGRLTLTSGVPVLMSDVTGAGTVYYTPYRGLMLPLWNGASYDSYSIGGELSHSMSGATANKNYDLFVYHDPSGTKLIRGPAWTSDTARGSGAGTTELEMLRGIQVNKQAISGGPAARRGTYVGTIRTNGSGTVDMIFGATPAAGGSNGFCGVYNEYNKVLMTFQAIDAVDTYTYNLTAWRAANNSVNNRVSFVKGNDSDDVAVTNKWLIRNGNPGLAAIGIGYDSTTALSGDPGQCLNPGFFLDVSASFDAPGIQGLHYVQAIERSIDGGVCNFYGDNGAPGYYQSVLRAKIFA